MHGVRGSLVATLAAGTARWPGAPAGIARVEEPSPLPTVEHACAGNPARAAKQPNIVFVLMDDFSMDLLPTMRSAGAMERQGASYPHAFVTDSLCCVSRASMFTGQYPHQTGVRINTPSSLDPTQPLGGYEAFEAYGNGERTFAVRLQQAGYTTGFVGKFLNRYEYVPGGRRAAPPPGWSDFNVLFGSAYDGWGFWPLVRRGRADERPPATASRRPTPAPRQKDRSYAGTVTQRIALDFIARAPRRRAAVLPRGRAVRAAQPDRARGRLPGRPVLPAGVP